MCIRCDYFRNNNKYKGYQACPYCGKSLNKIGVFVQTSHVTQTQGVRPIQNFITQTKNY